MLMEDGTTSRSLKSWDAASHEGVIAVREVSRIVVEQADKIDSKAGKNTGSSHKT